MGSHVSNRRTFQVLIVLLLCVSVTFTRTIRSTNDTSSKGQGHHDEDHVITHPSNGDTQEAEVAYDDHTDNVTDHHGNHSDDDHHDDEHHGVHLASLNFDHVKEPLIITIFLLAVALCKLGFHHANFLSSKVPESCLLIILGTIVGGILHVTLSSDEKRYFDFSSDLFFLYLLPPIILESAYSLHDRVFFDNLGSILLFAVAGTILNCFILSPLLYGLAIGGAMGPISISLIECFVFGSLIVAVDPVAVLAIFQEVGVNNVLYFLVFGESLLNDAVTVVLYNTMREFNKMDSIPPEQIVLGFLSFFTISLGGLAIGLLVGALCAFFTRFTNHVRVVEPLAIFSLAYLAYLLAELFHFSGIISIIGCGLMQAQYAFHNVSHKSLTTVKYFGKMLSATCDSVIFMFLGLSLVSDQHEWHTGFILWSVFLCLGLRFLIVYFLAFLANKLQRLRKLDWEEQFIMAYGGLRGAVAFSLIAMISVDELGPQRLFETTTLVVIIFTVFVQGITIKPLVNLLRISKAENNPVSIYDEINDHVTDHVMAGIEEIIGHYGHNYLREWLDHIDNKYIRCWLMRNPTTNDDQIMEIYQKIAIQMHCENVGGANYVEDFSSNLEIYKPHLIECDPAAGRPDLAHISIDVEDDLRRKSYANSAGTYGRYSIFTRGPSLALPTTPTTPRRSAAPAEDGDGEKKRADTVLSDDVFMDRGLVAGSTEKVAGEVVTSRRSSLQSSRAVSQTESPIAEPTAALIRKWLVKNPSKDGYHRKYDRNLTAENNHDLIYHLQQKNHRNMRKRGLATSGSRPTSPTASPYGSPRGSQIDLYNNRRSTLGIIPESSAPGDVPSGPSSRPLPTSRRPVSSRAAWKGRTAFSQSLDTPTGKDKSRRPLSADQSVRGQGGNSPVTADDHVDRPETAPLLEESRTSSVATRGRDDDPTHPSPRDSQELSQLTRPDQNDNDKKSEPSGEVSV